MCTASTQQDDGVSRAKRSDELLYVVGVGASAGGLEALEQLFRSLPADTGMSFVVVQHLSPDFQSLMDELLLRQTEMPVHTVEDGMQLEPNAIYLIPPKKEMIVSGGKLLLTDKDPAKGLSLPIDTFFRSLAADAGTRAIGIVLSGTGSDGSRGIRDIHDSGGLVIVQSEDTAKFDGMPRSAQETGVVDLVLSPEQIAETLVQYSRNPIISQLTSPTDKLPVNEDATKRLMRLLRDQYGIDFSLYKPTTVMRRIERRLLLNQLTDFEQYVEQVANNPKELDLLYHDLLIGVTQFFRDRDAFALLEKQVLPELLDKHNPDEEFRIWVAGCATGEEAYSLAILLHEKISQLDRPVQAKVFATDVHQQSLDIAGTGVYPETALTEVSEERRNRYFSRRGDSYHVNQDLRKMVVFAQHNVIKDAPFTRIDLVSCRNLLIYFQPIVQKKVISLFHFGLKSNGTLFLGPSEGLNELGDEFITIDQHWKLFRKRRDIRLLPHLRMPLSGGIPQLRLPHATNRSSLVADGELGSAYHELLEQFVPDGVLINEQLEVVHVFGQAADYLQFKPGRTSTKVLDLFSADLRTVVSGAIHRASKEKKPVSYTGVGFQNNGASHQLKLGVLPLAKRATEPIFLLITLEPVETPTAISQDPEAIDIGEVSRERIGQLESDLRRSRESLQSTIEELETSNEELHATNEELVASNEELQSTNEELHSVNEELYTVNAEHQRKITELTELTDDIENLLTSTDVGVLFLDVDLCIRKFTPRIARSFNILEQDIGRSFDNFTHNIELSDLMETIRWVLTTGQPFERDVQDRFGKWFFLRVLPYHSHDEVGGVVLTLIDIGSVKRAEAELRAKDVQLQGLLDNSPAFLFIKDLDGHYLLVNRGCRRVLGKKPEQVLGKTDYDFLTRSVADRIASHDRAVATSGEVAELEEVIPRKGKGRTYLATKYPLRDESGSVSAVAGILTDITGRKLAERRAASAIKQRDQFLAMMSHELRNPLAAIVGATDMLQKLELPDAKLQHICQIIQRQTQQTSRLLDDLLDISRIAQGKIELRRQPIDLRTTTEAAIEAARSIISHHNHQLAIDIPDESIWIEGDSARLQQIQVNLLVNAAKYTHDGGEIGLELSQDDGQATIRVRDNGIGMSKEFQKRMFEPFVQSKRTIDRREGGVGLGLTLVRSLTDLHDGTVTAHSDGPGQGSSFTVQLPLTKRRPEIENSQTSDSAPSTKSLKLLLVEDNADVASMTQYLLEDAGHEVHTAADGLAGLVAIEAEKPDVALIDIGLPELDGYEVARRVRQNDEHIYLVALTGYGQSADRERAISAGFNEHLTKPVDFDRLQSLLVQVST